MAHRLLVPPVRRMEAKARLPMLQDIGGANVANLQAALMPRDALRQAKTSQAMIATGPLSTPQRFVVAAAGGPNSPENMNAGLRKHSARIANGSRGQAVGI